MLLLHKLVKGNTVFFINFRAVNREAMDQREQQLDIETLLGTTSGLGRQNDVFDVLGPLRIPQVEEAWKDFSDLAKPPVERYSKHFPSTLKTYVLILKGPL